MSKQTFGWLVSIIFSVIYAIAGEFTLASTWCAAALIIASINNGKQ